MKENLIWRVEKQIVFKDKIDAKLKENIKILLELLDIIYISIVYTAI